MNRSQKILLAMLMAVQGSLVYSDNMQNFVGSMQSFFDQTKTMFEGMPQMFGVAPAGYSYSFEIINDSDQLVTIYLQQIKAVMGGYFPGDIQYQHTLNPYQASFPTTSITSTPSSNSASATTSAPSTNGWYKNLDYYFAIFMGASPVGSSVAPNNFYKQYLLQLGAKNDTSVVYYHVFTGKRIITGSIAHMPMVEVVGVINPAAKGDDVKSNLVFDTALTQMNFYNTTSQSVPLVVTTADGKQYANVTIEPNSYNMLFCPDAMSFRGSSLAFGGSSPFKTIPLSKIGVQNSIYTFEIYQDAGQQGLQAGIQGFNSGNYDQCVSTNVRDISPQQATLWVQSLAQQNDATSTGAGSSGGNFDLPGQVWMVYKTPSMQVMQKCAVGNVTNLQFTRPSLQDQIGHLYFIYVNTQDDNKATVFINNFLQGKFGTSAVQQAMAIINTPINIQDVSALSTASTATGVTAQQQIQAITATNSSLAVTASSKNATMPSPTSISAQIAQQVLSGTVPSNLARLQDPSTQQTGYLLGIDVYTPFGGILSPISYYQLNPVVLSVETLSGLLNQYIDVSKVQSVDINSQVMQWLSAYIQNSATAQTAVNQFLTQYGLNTNAKDSNGNPICNESTCIVNNATLTKHGTQVVASFVNGLVSLANPPILYQPVVFQIPASTPPKGMPGAPVATPTTTS